MEFKQGEVYYAESLNGSIITIRRLSESGDNLWSKTRIIITDVGGNKSVKFLDDDRYSFSSTKTIRPAYPHEVSWLEECEKAGKLVKPDGFRDMPYADRYYYKTIEHVHGYTKGDIVNVVNNGLVFPTHPVRVAFGFSQSYNVPNKSFLKIIDFVIINENVKAIIGQDVVNPTEHVIIDVSAVELANPSDTRYFNDILNNSLKKVNVSQPVMGTQQLNNNQNGNTESSTPIKIERLVSRVTTGERPSGSIFRGRTSKRTVESRCIIYNQSVIRG